MDANYLQPTKKIIMAIMLTGLNAFAALNCLQPLIPSIGQAYNLRPASAAMVISVGMLGMAIALSMLTFFAERFPRKKGIVAALCTCSVMTTAMGLIPSFSAMLGSRFIIGLSIAFIPTLVLAYIQEEFDPKKIAYMSGLYVSGTTLGGLSGRLVISFIADLLNWKSSITAIGIILLCISFFVWHYLPEEKHRSHLAKKFDWGFFSLKNKSLFAICFIAFLIMGSFVAAYNFIPFVLKAPPYNFSQSVIGMIFMVQICGSFSSAMSGKFVTKYGTPKTMAAELFIMLAGILITLHTSVILKIIGLCAINFGFFGAHACATGWAGRLCPAQKVASVAVYMFCYYCGASIIGSLGGVFYQNYGWYGVTLMVTGAIILSMLSLFGATRWSKSLTR